MKTIFYKQLDFYFIVFTIYLLIFASYIMNWKFLPLSLIFILSTYLFYNKKILKNIFLVYFLYLLLILIYSFIHNHNLKLILMDSKILFIMILFYFSYIMSYKRIIKVNKKLITSLYILLILLYIFGMLGMYGIRFGNRDDFGNAIVILDIFFIYVYSIMLIPRKRIIFILLTSILILFYLQGRTALIAFVFMLGLLFLYKQKLQIKINKTILFTIISFSFILGAIVFLNRAGLDDEGLKHEARYLAYFIFIDILKHIDFQHFFFGFGFGAYFDKFADAVPIAAHHVTQIKNSSGVGHYISWGFHNNIIRMFLLTGFIGLVLLFWWQLSLFKLKKYDYYDDKLIKLIYTLKILFFTTLLLSFSNGIYGITLTGGLLFVLQGLLYGEIKFRRKIFCTKNIYS